MDFLELFDGLDIELKSGKVVIEGIRYNLTDFRKELFNIIDITSQKGIDLMKIKATDEDKYKDVSKDIYEAIKRELRPSFESSLEVDSTLINLTPVVSMDEDEVFLVDETLGEVSEVAYRSWIKAVDIDVRKAVLNSAMPMARFYFNPYDITSKVIRKEVSGLDMVHINTYSPPMWRKNANINEEIPELLNEFMTHLVPIEEQREYCLSWMAEAVFGRNETYLVLNGDKGVGKNTIYEIMKAVISPRYCVTAPASLTTSHFNNVLKDKRLILLDEYKITRSNHLFLKKIINKNQTIEKKGVDADKEFETFNSFMVFHNDVSDMYIERDDRRFSVLDITKTNLLELWDADQIHELIVELNKPESELTKAIGEYLLYRFENIEFNNVLPFKGERFHEIVEYHMPTWLQIVVAMIENGDVIDGEISFKKEIEKKLANEMMGKKKIQWRKTTLDKVLKEYKYKDKFNIGKIEKDGKGLLLKINQELLDQFDHYGLDVELEEEDDLL